MILLKLLNKYEYMIYITLNNKINYYSELDILMNLSFISKIIFSIFS